MKKFFGLMLIVGVFAVSVACDKKEGEGAGTDTTATEQPATPVAPDAAADTTQK
jgi:hypothetical protein